jgi:hypothetical protein
MKDLPPDVALALAIWQATSWPVRIGVILVWVAMFGWAAGVHARWW